jgi:hypothetical protein
LCAGTSVRCRPWCCEALVEPLVLVGPGAVRPGRDQVQAVTGETNKDRQGAVVKHALENLRLVYVLMDRHELGERRSAGRVRW